MDTYDTYGAGPPLRSHHVASLQEHRMDKPLESVFSTGRKIKKDNKDDKRKKNQCSLVLADIKGL